MNLPQPVTREEIYLAYYIGMRGDFSLPANPATRIETYLAKLCGQSVTLPDEPITNVEMYLAKLCGETVTLPDVPVLRVEMYLAALCGETVNLPEEPYTKTEIYLAYAATSTVYDLDIDGDSATIEDTIEGANLYAQQLYGKTSQETLTGKNLWGGFETTYISPQGFTTSWHKNGSIEITGTATADGWSVTTASALSDNCYITLPAGTYTFQFTSNATRAQIVSVLSDGTGETAPVDITASTGEQTFTLAETRCIYPRIRVSEGSTNLYANFMIVAGSTAGDYEPYTGSTPSQTLPSPNPDYPQDVNVVTGGQTIQIRGKNLFDINTLAQGGITVNNGEAVGTAGQFFTNFGANAGGVTFENPNEQLTISLTAYTNGEEGSAGNGISVRIVYTDSTYSSVAFPNSTATPTKKTLTSEAGKTISMVALSYGTTTNNTWHLSEFQIESGPTATAYEPYARQSYEINLGKNLLDSSTNGWGYITSGGAVDGTTSKQNVLSDYIAVPPDTTYTLSVGNITSGQTTRLNFAFFTTDKTFISRDAQSSGSSTYRSTTTPTNCGYMRVFIYKSPDWTDEEAGSAEFQLELGSTATAYVPYFTPIELAGIGTYVDKIFKNTPESDLYNPDLIDGAWYKYAKVGKVILTGASDETWTTGGNSAYAYHTIDNAYQPANRNTVSLILSDYYLADTYNKVASTTIDYGIALDSDNAGRLAVRNKDHPSASSLKSWLSTHNTTIYYALATPTATQITEASLLEELEALYLAYTYAGITNIFISSSGGGLTVGFNAKVRKAAE